MDTTIVKMKVIQIVKRQSRYPRPIAPLRTIIMKACLFDGQYIFSGSQMLSPASSAQFHKALTVKVNESPLHSLPRSEPMQIRSRPRLIVSFIPLALGLPVVRSTKTWTNSPTLFTLSTPFSNKAISYVTEDLPSLLTLKASSATAGNEMESK